ncbi:MAG: PfkB family carbohydrate kinase [Defluviitaleaceae bacterium]|nr:PfkB family carbohydrate kinase [Defluviitaleaceae bacterium]
MISKVFGTGGIGTGMFFHLHDNRAMSRDESRLGQLMDFQDYCKGHIILHYVAVLTKNIPVYAIGMVGQDSQGEGLLHEMQAAGINTQYVGATDKARTMLSICYQYPDGMGGNITTSNSASGLVTPEYIEKCASSIDENSLVLAAPEVPMASRIRLLEIAKEKKAFTVSSFLAEEAVEFEESGGFALPDLIAINGDEAAAVASGGIEESAKKILSANPCIKLIITAGGKGSYLFEGNSTSHIPAIPVEIKSTAGAGDAFLGGTIAGLIQGKSFPQAAKYGAAAAYFAVSDNNTIAKDINIEKIEKLLEG